MPSTSHWKPARDRPQDLQLAAHSIASAWTFRIARGSPPRGAVRLFLQFSRRNAFAASWPGDRQLRIRGGHQADCISHTTATGCLGRLGTPVWQWRYQPASPKRMGETKPSPSKQKTRGGAPVLVGERPAKGGEAGQAVLDRSVADTKSGGWGRQDEEQDRGRGQHRALMVSFASACSRRPNLSACTTVSLAASLHMKISMFRTTPPAYFLAKARSVSGVASKDTSVLAA